MVAGAREKLVELRTLVAEIATTLEALGLEENANELRRRVERDDLAAWLDGAYGSEIWAEVSGSLACASLFTSGRDGRTVFAAQRHQARANVLVSEIVSVREAA